MLWWLLLSVLVAVSVSTVVLRFLRRAAASSTHAIVLVLGDLGHSPRMMYHALSLANAGMTVSFVGLDGTKPHESVRSHPRITLVPLAPFDARRLGALGSSTLLPLRAFVMLLKVLYQVFSLFIVLSWSLPRPRFLLLQTPPAIPTIAVARAATWLRGARLVIDWHNLGYSILALGSLGKSLPALVSLAKRIEFATGSLADSHFAVTDALCSFLVSQGVCSRSSITAVHDQPAASFTSLTPLPTAQVAHELFARIESQAALEGLPQAWLARGQAGGGKAGTTMLTEVGSGKSQPELRSDRPALIVSGTSWSEDEDFSLLLEALVALDAVIAASRTGAVAATAAAAGSNTGVGAGALPDVLVVATGRGPLKAHYTSLFASAGLKHIAFTTAWLAAEDYPRLLRVADVGVSLHKSSSGLDLPMKVVDMQGVNLPVCAVSFPALPELVRHQENGLVFTTGGELALQLQGLLRGFPGDSDCGQRGQQSDCGQQQQSDCGQLGRLRRALEQGQGDRRWDTRWMATAAPVLLGMSAGSVGGKGK